jgi:hypothetical protein
VLNCIPSRNGRYAIQFTAPCYSNRGLVNKDKYGYGEYLTAEQRQPDLVSGSVVGHNAIISS